MDHNSFRTYLSTIKKACTANQDWEVNNRKYKINTNVMNSYTPLLYILRTPMYFQYDFDREDSS